MFRPVLASIAPGTALREGLDRILRGRTGGLIVLGWNRTVDAMSTGGFPIDIDFSATRLRELCKMDGAVILTEDGSRIVRAGVQLMPDAAIATDEAGTRHRTAQRVSIQAAVPVIAVSQSMNAISVYVTGERHQLDHPTVLQGRASQAIATLEKYKLRLDEVATALSALEVADLVTVRDVLAVSQRIEMVSRIAAEIDGYVDELGTEGRLVTLQLEELMAGVVDDRELVVSDYLQQARRTRSVADVLGDLDAIPSGDLIDMAAIAPLLGFSASADSLEQPVRPRGYRLLARVPRLPVPVIDRLVATFGDVQKLLAANIDDLQTVDGVGEARARGIRESMTRLAEKSAIERRF